MGGWLFPGLALTPPSSPLTDRPWLCTPPSLGGSSGGPAPPTPRNPMGPPSPKKSFWLLCCLPAEVSSLAPLPLTPVASRWGWVSTAAQLPAKMPGDRQDPLWPILPLSPAAGPRGTPRAATRSLKALSLPRTVSDTKL